MAECPLAAVWEGGDSTRQQGHRHKALGAMPGPEQSDSIG